VNPSAVLCAILLRLDGAADLAVAEVEAAMKYRVGAAAMADGQLRVTAIPPPAEGA
jgi:hypothetical protein